MDQRGWVPATAGNISVRLSSDRIAITRSGVHKGFLDSFSVIEVDLQGRSITADARASAETLLHCQLYHSCPQAGAVLHGHSVSGTVLSMVTKGNRIVLEGYELFKAFADQTTHQQSLCLPIFDNDQDVARLCTVIKPHLGEAPLGYYIRGHGAYVWASNMDTALARLEALEFLLDCELARRQLTPSRLETTS